MPDQYTSDLYDALALLYTEQPLDAQTIGLTLEPPTASTTLMLLRFMESEQLIERQPCRACRQPGILYVLTSKGSTVLEDAR